MLFDQCLTATAQILENLLITLCVQAFILLKKNNLITAKG